MEKSVPKVSHTDIAPDNHDNKVKGKRTAPLNFDQVHIQAKPGMFHYEIYRVVIIFYRSLVYPNVLAINLTNILFFYIFIICDTFSPKQ